MAKQLARKYEAFCAMRNDLNELFPVQSADADLLTGPEISVSCVAIVEAARAALTASAPATGDGWRTKAVDDVLAERRRQIEAEGWTPEHDDKHDQGELARAAGLYALITGADATAYRNARDGYSLNDYLDAVMKEYWPFDRSWFKPTNRYRDLVKAGALIIGELERLERLPAAPTATGGRG